MPHLRTLHKMTKEKFQSLVDRSGSFEELLLLAKRKRSSVYTYAWKYGIELRNRWPTYHEPGYLYRRRGVYIHRDIAEGVLGRPLKSTEVVHHIDGDKQNNRKDNFVICSSSYHIELHARMSYLYQKLMFQTPLSR